MLNLEYEQKVLNIEKTLTEQTTNNETKIRRLEIVNQNLFTHIIRLTRRIELLEQTSKRRRNKCKNKETLSTSYPWIPTDIYA